jgi:hypothetical protein
MKYSVLALACGSTLAAVVIAVFQLHSEAGAAPEISVGPTVEAFQLQANGEAVGCMLEKTAGAGPLSRITVAQACDDLLPGLSTMQYWMEDSDGMVKLSADGKTATVVFALADGVAYESVEPRMPLMSLIAAN